MTTIEQWTPAGQHSELDLDAALEDMREHAVDPAESETTPTNGRGTFVWIRVDGDDLETLRRVGAALNLDARVQRALEHLHRPGSEQLAQGHYLALATLWYTPDGALVETGEVHCLVIEGGVVTVERGKAEVCDKAAELLRQWTAAPMGPATVMRAIAAAVVGEASEVTDDLGEAVTKLESVVFSTDAADPVEQIYLLKREVSEARRALGPIALTLSDLGGVTPSPLGRRDHAALRQLTSHVQRCADQVDGYDRMLGDMLQAHLAIVSVRQNSDMRKMSAWAGIAAVCTVVAGIYGMNFDHMPELHWPLGYLWAIGLMAAVGFVLYRAFKRSGWL